MQRRVRALVRGVADSLPAALTAVPPDPPLDAAVARAQHRDYAAALVGAGAEVTELPPDEACPDCCFIEDTAVIVGGIAVVTRPGAPSRRAEVGPVAAQLAAMLPIPIERMEAPATLDGGDCLLLGPTLHVGASARSNPAGRAWLRALLAPRGIDVVEVAMPPGILHLKSVCAPLGERLVLVRAGTLPPGVFGDAEVIVVPTREAQAANAVAVGDTVLVAAGCPMTRARVEAAGWKTIDIDTSELRRADGALTCLSILLPW